MVNENFTEEQVRSYLKEMLPKLDYWKRYDELSDNCLLYTSDTYEGCCPYHGACLEGLASGPAIQGRYGRKGAELAGREDVWELESYYIGQAVADYMLTYSPEKIILWGGVMHLSLIHI